MSFYYPDVISLQKKTPSVESSWKKIFACNLDISTDHSFFNGLGLPFQKIIPQPFIQRFSRSVDIPIPKTNKYIRYLSQTMVLSIQWHFLDATRPKTNVLQPRMKVWFNDFVFQQWWFSGSTTVSFPEVLPSSNQNLQWVMILAAWRYCQISEIRVLKNRDKVQLGAGFLPTEMKPR